TPEDDRPGATPTVILSYSGWLKLFGPQQAGPLLVSRTTNLVGETLRFNGLTYNVIGVLPREFSFYVADTNQEADGYVPIRLASDQWMERARRPGLSAIGRLNSGSPLAAASTELDNIARRLATLYPDANENRGAAVRPILEEIVNDDVRTTLS